MHLGIDESSSYIYEGSSFYGAALTPKPIVSPASIISLADNPTECAPSGRLSECEFIFREDTYDPVTRIRRGRFYNFMGTQNWFILVPKPSQYDSAGGVGMVQVSKHFPTFSVASIWCQFLRDGQTYPVVILGSKNRFTLWRVISIETNISGEEIVVLRGRHSFGALPDVDGERIPSERREKVLECLQKLQEDIFRAGPASVIDRARDAAAAILRAHLGDDAGLKKDADLGLLARKFRDLGAFENVSNAGDIVRILHSRAKPSVQEKIPDIRQAHEQDAEFAVQCIGSILCDLGWAEWK